MTAPLLLPTPLPTAAGWQLTDYKPDLTLRGTAAPDGTITAVAEQIESGVMWAIQRAVCSCTSARMTQLRLYDSAVDVDRILSGSNAGNLDEAEYPAGLLLASGRQLVAQWTGADSGSKAALRLQVAVLRYGG